MRIAVFHKNCFASLSMVSSALSFCFLADLISFAALQGVQTIAMDLPMGKIIQFSTKNESVDEFHFLRLICYNFALGWFNWIKSVAQSVYQRIL